MHDSQDSMKHHRAVVGEWLSTVLLSNLLGNHLNGHAQHPSFSLFHDEIESHRLIAVSTIGLRNTVEVIFAGYHHSPCITCRTPSYKVMPVNAIVTNYLQPLSTSDVILPN